MAQARNAFSIIAGSSALALATFIGTGPAEGPGVSLNERFNHQAAPEDDGTSIRLVIVTPDGRERSYTDPLEIRRALDEIAPVPTPPRRPADEPQLSERERLERELQALTEDDPVPYKLLVRLARSESGFDTDAISSEGARGILQFMPRTQLEQLYLHKDKLPAPYAAIADNIEQVQKRGTVTYRVKPGADPDQIYALADEPTVAFILGREYVRHIAEMLRDKLPGKKLTYTDIKAAYVFGPTGAVPFLKAAADPKKRRHRALDYIDDTAVAGNPGLFYARPKARRSPRTVEWLYNHFREKMGTDPVPENLDPAAEGHMLASNLPIPIPPPRPPDL